MKMPLAVTQLVGFGAKRPYRHTVFGELATPALVDTEVYVKPDLIGASGIATDGSVIPMAVGGTLHSWSVYVNQNTRAVGNLVIALRAQQLQIATITVPPGVTGKINSSDLVRQRISIADTFSYGVTPQTSVAGVFRASVQLSIDVDDGSYFVYGWPPSVDGESKYGSPLFSYRTGTGTPESDYGGRCPVAARVDRFGVVVLTNAADGPTICRLRKNGAATGASFSIPAGATGLFVDDVNASNVIVGDVLTCEIDSQGNTGAVDMRSCFARFVSATKHLLGGGMLGTQTVSSGGTRYWQPLGNGGVSFFGPSAAYRSTNGSAWRIEKCHLFIAANSIATGDSVFTLLRNAVATDITVSVPAMTTGWFEMSSQLALAEDDYLTMKCVAGSGGGSIAPSTVLLVSDPVL